MDGIVERASIELFGHNMYMHVMPSVQILKQYKQLLQILGWHQNADPFGRPSTYITSCSSSYSSPLVRSITDASIGNKLDLLLPRKSHPKQVPQSSPKSPQTVKETLSRQIWDLSKTACCSLQGISNEDHQEVCPIHCHTNPPSHMTRHFFHCPTVLPRKIAWQGDYSSHFCKLGKYGWVKTTLKPSSCKISSSLHSRISGLLSLQHQDKNKAA